MSCRNDMFALVRRRKFSFALMITFLYRDMCYIRSSDIFTTREEEKKRPDREKKNYMRIWHRCAVFGIILLVLFFSRSLLLWDNNNNERKIHSNSRSLAFSSSKNNNNNKNKKNKNRSFDYIRYRRRKYRNQVHWTVRFFFLLLEIYSKYEWSDFSRKKVFNGNISLAVFFSFE